MLTEARLSAESPRVTARARARARANGQRQAAETDKSRTELQTQSEPPYVGNRIRRQAAQKKKTEHP